MWEWGLWKKQRLEERQVGGYAGRLQYHTLNLWYSKCSLMRTVWLSLVLILEKYKYLCSEGSSLIAPDVYVLWSTLFWGWGPACLSEISERGNFSSATLIIFPSPSRHQRELFMSTSPPRQQIEHITLGEHEAVVSVFAQLMISEIAFFLQHFTRGFNKYYSAIPLVIRSALRVCACEGIWFLSKMCICI